MRTTVITHRGLEPSRDHFYPESSIEAFENQLHRGFGLEFDPNFVLDGIVVSHDATLTRITNGRDTRNFSELTTQEATCIQYGENTTGHIATLDELLGLIEKNSSPLHALHLKGKFQEPMYLEKLVKSLRTHRALLDRILIFDAKPDTARYFKNQLPAVHIAPSVTHPYDMQRYNGVVQGTLLSIAEALQYKKENIYDWVWLDEWDLNDTDGKRKILYNAETFHTLREAGYRIALVTPELHGTSPGLLGGEAHPDARTKDLLFHRIRKIIALSPDALCTDFPEEVCQLL